MAERMLRVLVDDKRVSLLFSDYLTLGYMYRVMLARMLPQAEAAPDDHLLTGIYIGQENRGANCTNRCDRWQ